MAYFGDLGAVLSAALVHTYPLYPQAPVIAIALCGVAIGLFSSLQHEVLHGQPFANPHMNEALVFPAFTIRVPYRRFRATHLAHHYDDLETNVMDPAVWAQTTPILRLVFQMNNTLLRPILGNIAWLRSEIGLVHRDSQGVRRAWAFDLGGVALWRVYAALCLSDRGLYRAWTAQDSHIS